MRPKLDLQLKSSTALSIENDEFSYPLKIKNYDDLNVNDAVAAIKDLSVPRDVRVIIAYEEAHKSRQGVISAAQTRVAAIAKEAVGIS